MISVKSLAIILEIQKDMAKKLKAKESFTSNEVIDMLIDSCSYRLSLEAETKASPESLIANGDVDGGLDLILASRTKTGESKVCNDLEL